MTKPSDEPHANGRRGPVAFAYMVVTEVMSGLEAIAEAQDSLVQCIERRVPHLVDGGLPHGCASTPEDDVLTSLYTRLLVMGDLVGLSMAELRGEGGNAEPRP